MLILVWKKIIQLTFKILKIVRIFLHTLKQIKNTYYKNIYYVNI